MNASALVKGLPNRLDIKFHSFYPTSDNTYFQLCHLNQYQGYLNEINNTSAVWARSPELMWVYFLDPCRTWYDST